MTTLQKQLEKALGKSRVSSESQLKARLTSETCTCTQHSLPMMCGEHVASSPYEAPSRFKRRLELLGRKLVFTSLHSLAM